VFADIRTLLGAYQSGFALNSVTVCSIRRRTSTPSKAGHSTNPTLRSTFSRRGDYYERIEAASVPSSPVVAQRGRRHHGDRRHFRRAQYDVFDRERSRRGNRELRRWDSVPRRLPCPRVVERWCSAITGCAPGAASLAVFNGTRSARSPAATPCASGVPFATRP